MEALRFAKKVLFVNFYELTNMMEQDQKPRDPRRP